MTTILSNALPGFREVRAPLIAGYLWLLFAWLLAEPHVPADPTGLLRSFEDLRQTVGAVGFAVGLSVGAYLVGSVSQALSTLFLRVWDWMSGLLTAVGGLRGALSRVLSSVGSRSARLRSTAAYDSQLQRRPTPEALLRQRIGAKLRALTVCLKPLRDYNEGIEKRIRDINDQPSSASTSARAAATDRLRNEIDDSDTLIDSFRRRLNRAAAIARGQLRREVELPATLLVVGENDRLYTEADRLRAEGELRLAVCPPLFALAVLLSVDGSGAWLFALPVTAVLFVLGVSKIQDARGVISRAIRYGTIESAALDDFEKASSEV
ncbi:MAG: hypothetical protein QOH76_4037, partial [Thermoleophilaceae bacterium]|nr:hypothetical protein [Thermoleophilaceae bacterium]